MKKKQVRFLPKAVVLEFHREQIQEHGGLHGEPNNHLLESALNRPLHLYAYSNENIDLASLAASYAYGIAKNHPFFDGNKRTATVVLEVFLIYNDHQLIASNADIFSLIILLASSGITEQEFADFIRKNIKPL